MISQHFKDKWPQPCQWTIPNYLDFTELMRKAKLYDEMTAQKDCEAADKTKWREEVEKYLVEKYGLKSIEEATHAELR
jgi:hypothetical protein